MKRKYRTTPITSIENVQVEDDVERLIILRKRLNQNQYQFAKSIGITGQYLNEVENKNKAFTVKLKKTINHYLEAQYRGHHL